MKGTCSKGLETKEKCLKEALFIFVEIPVNPFR